MGKKMVGVVSSDEKLLVPAGAMSVAQLIDTVTFGASNATLLDVASSESGMGCRSITVDRARSTLVNILEDRKRASGNVNQLNTVVAFESRTRVGTPDVPIIAYLLGILPDGIRNIVVFNNAYRVGDVDYEILDEAFDRLRNEYGLHVLCCPVRSDSEKPKIIRNQRQRCLLADGRDYRYRHGVLSVPGSKLSENSYTHIRKRFLRETVNYPAPEGTKLA